MVFKKGNIPWIQGKHHLPETIERLRSASLGNKSHFGHKHNEETKKKMRISRQRRVEHGEIIGFTKGHINSEESKKKMSISHKGRHCSPDTEFKKGHITWIKGKHHSIKTKEKMRINRLKNPIYYWLNRKKPLELCKRMSEVRKGRHFSPNTEFEKGLIPWNTGKSHTKETKEKIRAKRSNQIFPFKDTSIEVALQNALTERGISFTKHKPITGQPDIFIEPNVCIFADGCYWHGCEQCHDKNKFAGWQRKAQFRGIFVTQKLINDGYIVLRFWEHEIKKNADLCVLQIKEKIECLHQS